MSDVAQPVIPPAPERRGRGWIILAGFVAVDFILGAAAGVYAGLTFGTDAAPVAAEEGQATATPEATHAPRLDIDVGRITVVLPMAEGGRKMHLLLTPLVVAHPEDGEAEEGAGHGAADGDAPTGVTAELRDTFIEFLSQLHAEEVQGTSGLALIRSELLRRARAVAPGLNASAVLIQEFIIQ